MINPLIQLQQLTMLAPILIALSSISHIVGDVSKAKDLTPEQAADLDRVLYPLAKIRPTIQPGELAEAALAGEDLYRAITRAIKAYEALTASKVA